MSENKPSFLTDMMNRRVPQFIGIYLAVSWGVIQFITWVVDRYLLSPYLVDLSFAVSISMLPSILVLSYFHGRPGKDTWTKVEKIVIPVNFIITAIAMLVVFYPKDLGAITKDVIITDQDGNTYSKTTVKSEFRKRYAIYLFENNTGDTSNDWLSYGMRFSLRQDFSQDLYLTNRGNEAHDIKYSMGFGSTERLSVSEMQNISERVLADYFITGTYDIVDGNYIINFKIYQTANAKIISDKTFENDNLFSLIDEASLQIKSDIGIPNSYLDNLKDLPVSEITTGSIDALKSYSLGTLSSEHADEFKFYKEAVEHDPKSAYFNLQLAFSYKFGNDIENYKKHISIAEKYSNKLSEKDKFGLQMQTSANGGLDLEKRRVILNMWIDLYPDDPEPYKQLAIWSELNGEVEETKNYYNKILELTPGAQEYILSLGDLYYGDYDFDSAEKYYLQYKNLYPKNPDTYFKIGRLYGAKEDYMKALEYFEKSKILGKKGSEIDIWIAAALSVTENWNPDKYADYLMDKVDQYKNETWFNEGVSAVYVSIQINYMLYGQYKKAMPYIDKNLQTILKNQGEAMYYFSKAHYLDCYANLGMKMEADKLIAEIEANLINTPPFNLFYPVNTMQYYSKIKDFEALISIIEKVMPALEQSGVDVFIAMAKTAHGDYYRGIGEYEKAIELYTQSLDLVPASYDWANHVPLGMIYSQQGGYEAAENHFKKALVNSDYNAHLFYEYALFKEKSGDLSEARNYIEKAYKYFKNADEEVEMGHKIRDKYKQLTIKQ